MSQYKYKMLYVEHSRFYPHFLLNFWSCPGFRYFEGKFQAISGPGQTKLKPRGFQGSAGNPVRMKIIAGLQPLPFTVTW